MGRPERLGLVQSIEGRKGGDIVTGMVLTKTREEGKYELIKELRSVPEVISAIRRGLEARRNGDRIHWNEVKAELGL